MNVTLNIWSLTGSEVVDIETAASMSFRDIAQAIDTNTVPAAALIALRWIAERRTNPTLTVDEVKDRSYLDTAGEFTVDVQRNPTEPADS